MTTEMTNNNEPQPVLTLAILWRSRMKTMFGVVEMPISRKHLGQLGKLKKYLGDKTPQVIEWALTNWANFASKASAEASTESWPPKPHIGFLLKHHAVAVKEMQSIAEHEKQKQELNAKYEAEDKAKKLAAQKKALYEPKLTPAQVKKFKAAFGTDKEEEVWAEIELENKIKGDAAWAEIEKKNKPAA
jgi:hypothetical protein